jgi:DMSO/TMAO reductase YedYZ molybdopterin-dependent catalytic subunit
MATSTMTRRRLLRQSGAAAAGLTVLRVSGPAHAFQNASPSPVAGMVIPWLDQPAENPVPEVIVRQLQWESLESWMTPADQFFAIKHYNEPMLDSTSWALEVGGLVENPMTLTLDDIKNRERAEVTYTMECSGNSGLPFFIGGVGNATWAGTPLAPILEEAGVLEDGVEVVFWGADAGEQTWRDEITITEHFARSMSVNDAMAGENLLAYEMNGADLPNINGFPLRLIAPGWYGVANVKWLTRIEVTDTRYQGHFMARDYVTIREESHGDETVWTFSSVGRDRLKSAPARVVNDGGQYRITGAAWGAPIAGVEVRIDNGQWMPATLMERDDSGLAWTFWTFEWNDPAPGEHAVTSRATDSAGNVQPAPDDPLLAGKATYWESNGHITRRVSIDR